MSGPNPRIKAPRLQPLSMDELDRWAPVTLDAAIRADAAAADRAWGLCGVLACQDEELIGMLVLGPAVSHPADRAASARVSRMIAVWVGAEYRGAGLGRQLVQSAAAELTRRDLCALEAIAHPRRMPVGWLLAVGFRTVQPHPLAPRLRMDLTTTVRWRPDLAAAWHRITGLMPAPLPPVPPQPAARQAGSAQRYSSIAPSRTDFDLAPLNALTSSPPT